MSDRYLMVLGGGIMQVCAVEEAHRMGFKVIVSDRDEYCACGSLADQFLHLDIFDIDGHLNYLKTWRFAHNGPLPEGCLCWAIDAPETAAAMQEFLGKPTALREVARICHNKKEFRKACRVLGWPTPPTHSVVIKPLTNSGSRGVRIYESTSAQLVEEQWVGSEHTVETLRDCDGNFWPCFITDRIFDYSRGYALEVALRHPSTLPEYVQRKAYQIAEALGRDLGVTHGPFKLDIIVTEDGIRVIEATTRHSGGWDASHLVPAATGKNILRAGIMTCTGQTLEEEWTCDMFHGVDTPLDPKWDKVALSESLWPPPGKIVSIDGVEEAKAIPGVEHIFFRKKVGDMVNEYIDCSERVNWIITSGDTEQEARHAMERAKKTVRIEVEG